MFAGVGFHSGVRWGDYTRTEVDPSDGMDFWHINQYAQSGIWHTRIGKFNFQGGGPKPDADTNRYTGFLQLGGWTKHAQSRNPHGGCLFPG